MPDPRTRIASEPPEAQAAPRVLVCDHRGEGTAALVPALQGAGYQVELSEELRETLERLARGAPDLIVLDPLAAGAGVELEAIESMIRPVPGPNRRTAATTPVLVVTEDSRAVPALMRAPEGALWDLVHRDAPPAEHLMRLESLRRQAALSAELEAERYHARHDDRTDLLRPRIFTARLREHFSAAQRHEFDLALLLIDLDKFGQVNKRYDHTVGDVVITRVGEAIRKQLRTEDVAGRLGGDEFAVILPYTSPSDAGNVVQRLVDRIRELSGPIPGAGEPVETGASVGFETYNGKTKDLDAVETLREHAERALRVAKLAGGNRGVYYRNMQQE